MVLHNRRKRNAFYTEQHKIYSTRLIAAIETEKAGIPLAEDQLLILSREKKKIEAEEQKKALGYWGRAKRAVVGGLSMNMDGRQEQIIVPSEGEVLAKIGVSNVGVLEAIDGKAKMNQRGELQGVQPLIDEASKGTTKAAVVSPNPSSSLPSNRGNKNDIQKTTSNGWLSWIGWK